MFLTQAIAGDNTYYTFVTAEATFSCLIIIWLAWGKKTIQCTNKFRKAHVTQFYGSPIVRINF